MTPSKANVRGAEAVQEPEVEAKVEVKVEIVRNVPPCTKCAAKNVVCEGSREWLVSGVRRGMWVVRCEEAGEFWLVECEWITRY